VAFSIPGRSRGLVSSSMGRLVATWVRESSSTESPSLGKHECFRREASEIVILTTYTDRARRMQKIEGIKGDPIVCI